jgi:ABC-type transport system involved in resistance to organic solvents, periplasmic component
MNDKNDQLAVATKEDIQNVLQAIVGIDKKVDNLDKRVDNLDKKVDNLDKRVDNLDKRVDSLDKKVDNLDERFNRLDKKVDHIDKRVDHLEQKVNDLEQKTDDRIDDVLGVLDVMMARIDERFLGVEGEQTKMQVQIQSILDHLDSIEKRLEISEDERLVMAHQLTRLHDWVERAAKRINVEFIH